MEYLAHISDDKTRKQTVLEHSQNVAMLAKQYAKTLSAFPFLSNHKLGSGNCYSLCTVKKQEFIDEIALTSAL